jgi:hypothetical protein
MSGWLREAGVRLADAAAACNDKTAPRSGTHRYGGCMARRRVPEQLQEHSFSPSERYELTSGCAADRAGRHCWSGGGAGGSLPSSDPASAHTGRMPVQLDRIVVDAHDLPGLPRFRTQALGWKVLCEREGEIVIRTDENAPVGMCFMPVTDGTSDRPEPCSRVSYRKPDDEMPATGQRNRLDIQLVHHLSRDFPVASHDEIAPFQSTAATSRNGYPAQTGHPAHSGMPGFRSSSAGLPHGHDDRTNAREAR